MAAQIQVSEAEKDQSIGMKQAERDSKVKVAALRAQAIAGENEAEMKGKWDEQEVVTGCQASW